MSNFLGLPTTKSSRDTISRMIKELEEDGVLETKVTQQKFYLEKKYTFKLPLSWREIEQGPSLEQINDEVSPTEITQEKDNISTAIRQKNDSLKEDRKENVKESKLKSKNLKKISANESKLSENSQNGETLNFNNFNFFGLDEVSNPLTIISVIGLAKNTNLSLEQIQRSVKRFSEYIHSEYYQNEFPDPVALLCTHLRKFGEYVPREEYIENAHKEKPIRKEDYEDVIDMARALNYEQLENKELASSIRNECTNSSSEDILMIEKAKSELKSLFPKASFKSQGRVLTSICEKYLDSAVELVRSGLPVNMQNLAEGC